MKTQRIYIDTSVIGGCFDDEFSVWSISLFNDFKNGVFKPVISEVTVYEIADAPEYIKDKFSELSGLNVEKVEISIEAEELAKAYQARNILSAKYTDDALHIAIATIAEVDILVSWNFRHIVHFDKIRQFNSVNIELGYKPIQIYSPREVTRYGKED